MPKTRDLTNQWFGRLRVIEKADGTEDRYQRWLCQCKCGRQIIVNTKRLVRGTVTNCGCIPKNNAANGTIAENLKGRRFGQLEVLERVENKNGRVRWLCKCDCENTCIVSAHELKAGKTRSCGCYRPDRKVDLTNKNFDRLTALYPTDKRDAKGSVYWHCRCECQKELDVTEDCLVHGNYKSCGCRKQEIQSVIGEQLTFVDGTCLEWLKFRKHRSDNSSGYAGVSETSSGKWRASIGLQSQRFQLGTYQEKAEAIAVRQEAEEALHKGFLDAYDRWKGLAEEDPAWAKETPFYFRVFYEDGVFQIISPLNSTNIRIGNSSAKSRGSGSHSYGTYHN